MRTAPLKNTLPSSPEAFFEDGSPFYYVLFGGGEAAEGEAAGVFVREDAGGFEGIDRPLVAGGVVAEEYNGVGDLA